MTEQQKGNLYHLILGLSEEITAPNYYELLGLDSRTSDPKIIRDAAADQNRKLLSWQNSDRYAEVRALTFEVVQARDTLLNDAVRAAYDANLGDWGLADESPWIVEEPPPEPQASERRDSEPLSVRCPDCRAEFKLRNRELIGRRLPCPECGFRFTVRPVSETVLLEAEPVAEDSAGDAELAALDNFDDMEDLPSAPPPGTRISRRRNARDVVEVEPLPADPDEYEDYEAASPASRNRPRSRPREMPRTPARRPAARRSDDPSPRKWPVLIGGMLMAVAVVILLGVLIQKARSPAAADRNRLAYLPSDSQAVAYYRMGDIARSPYFQDHLTRAPQLRDAVDQFRDRMGMELHDVDALVIGLKDGSLSRYHAVGFNPQALRGMPFVAVARAAKDWDRTKLIGSHTQSSTHNNLTFHTFSPEGNPGERWALYLPDARTLLFGTVPEVQAAMDTAGRSPAWPDAEFLEREYAVIIAQVPGTNRTISSGPRAFGSGVPMAAAARTIGGGLMLGDEVRPVTFLHWNSEAEAAAYMTSAEQAGDQLRRMRSALPRPDGSLQYPSFTQHGRTVTVIESPRNRLTDTSSQATFLVPVRLLASLGPSSTPNPSPPVANANPVPVPPGNSRKRGENVRGHQLAPPLTATALNSLIAELQNPGTARQAAHFLSIRQPAPARQKEVAQILENLARAPGINRGTFITALGVWGTADNVPFLLGMLDDSDTTVKKYALIALAQIQDPRGIPELINALQVPATSYEGFLGLRYLGPAAEPALLNALADTTPPSTQQMICNILKDVGTARSLPQLDALASQGAEPLRSRAQVAAQAIRTRNPGN